MRTSLRAHQCGPFRFFFGRLIRKSPSQKRKVGKYYRSVLYCYGQYGRPKSTAQKGAVHISRVFTNTMPLLRLACFSAFFDVLAPTIDIMHQYQFYGTHRMVYINNRCDASRRTFCEEAA